MKCPKCGEELPLLTQICPVCKQEIVREGAPDPMELTQCMDQAVLDIRCLEPEASGIKIGVFVPLYLALAALFIGLIATKAGAALFWILAFGLLIWAFVMYRKRKAVTLAARFANLKISYDYGVTLLKRFYGNDRDMLRMMDENRKSVNQAQSVIMAAKRRDRLAGLGIAAAELAMLLVLWAVIPSASAKSPIPEDYDAQVAYYIGEAQPDKAIEAYTLSEFNDDLLGAPKRVALCEALCQAGYREEAASFVLTACLGKYQDFDCAKAVILSYVAASESEAAASFADKCVGMRYASDSAKLKALIK